MTRAPICPSTSSPITTLSHPFPPFLPHPTVNGAAPGATVTPPATFTVTLFTTAQGGQLGSCAINFVSGGVVYGSEAISVGP